MEVILRKDVPNLGNQGDIVTVKPGYARNYLIPQQFAMSLTKGSRRQIEAERAARGRRLQARHDEHQALADRLEDRSFTIAAKAGDTGRLFGSVGENEIIELLDTVMGLKIERAMVRLDDHIKQVGVYHVPIRFQEGIEPQIKIWIVPEGEESVGLPEDAPKPQLFVGGTQSIDIAKAHARELVEAEAEEEDSDESGEDAESYEDETPVEAEAETEAVAVAEEIVEAEAKTETEAEQDAETGEEGDDAGDEDKA